MRLRFPTTGEMDEKMEGAMGMGLGRFLGSAYPESFRGRLLIAFLFGYVESSRLRRKMDSVGSRQKWGWEVLVIEERYETGLKYYD